jgi:hypothetical protein
MAKTVAGAVLSLLTMGVVIFLPLYFLYTFVMGVMHGSFTDVMWYVKLAVIYLVYKAVSGNFK